MASNMYKPFQYQDALVSSAITMKVLLFATLTVACCLGLSTTNTGQPAVPVKPSKLNPAVPIKPTKPKPTTTADCVVTMADVVFVIDASGSVDRNEWKQSLSFAGAVAETFNIGPNAVKVALVTFSSQSQVIFDLQQYTTKKELLAALTNARKISGLTYINRGLDKVRLNVLTPAADRPDAPNLVFVITDGESKGDVKGAADRLKLEKNATIFAVGIDGAKRYQLLEIATSPSHISTYKDFTNLANLRDTFASETCKVAVKLAPTTTPAATPATTPAAPTKPPTTTTLAATTKPKDNGCTINKADIVFAVDTSSSVGEDNFKLTQAFLNRMLERFDFKNNRIGIIKFNDGVQNEFNLGQYSTLKAAQAAVDAMKYDKGPSTEISAAIKEMREVSLSPASGGRPNIPKIGIIVTDGQAKDAYRTYFEANKTKDEGIRLFAVGVGSDIDVNQLTKIASSPANDFVYIVKAYKELLSIREKLSDKLCARYTVPTTTMMAPVICVDAIDCSGYKRETTCYDGSFRAWAKKNCKLYCDLCEPHEILPPLPSPKPCVDKKDCSIYTNVCTDPSFGPWALENCARFCNLCDQVNTPRWQRTTGSPTTPTPTTPTTPTTTPPTTTPPIPTKTTSFVPPAHGCYDKERDCKGYSKDTCTDPRYKGYMQNACNEYCGYCTPPGGTTTPACVDKIDCSGYQDNICFDPKYKGYMESNCRKRCAFCGGATLATPTPPTECKDEEDCGPYGQDVCTDFKDFASRQCRAFCKFCDAPVTKAVCVNKQDCTGFDKKYCVDPDYRPFMLGNCRLYCDLCDADV